MPGHVPLSFRPHAPTSSTVDSASRILTRWRGLGAMIGVAFFSLFLSAHHLFSDHAAYVKDGLLFGARTQTVFGDLTAPALADHRGISPQHPAFTIIHQPLAQLFIEGLAACGQPLNYARKHGVALLTCLAGALSVVLVYHALLWTGMTWLRSLLFASVYGAGTAAWLASALPEVWIFAGLGVAFLAFTTAKGELAPGWLHVLAQAYALGCFLGNIVPLFLLTCARCAQDRSGRFRLSFRPLLWPVIAITVAFALANAQRRVYPQSQPLPMARLWNGDLFRMDTAAWPAEATAGRTAREAFIANFVAPNAVVASDPAAATSRSPHRQVQLEDAAWTRLDLHKGLAAAWCLILILALAGLIWRAQIDAYTLGILASLMWTLLALPIYGSPQTLLLHACLWSPLVVIAAGLGVERSLEHWRRLTLPVTVLLLVFISAQIFRNWWFLTQVAKL